MTRPTLALLGTGTLGRPMAVRLLAQGFPLRVWNRTAEKVCSLVELGAESALDPAAACRGALAAVLVLTDAAACHSVLFDSPAAADGLGPGGIVVQCSTVSPKENQLLESELAARGLRFLEAPVLGSRAQAERGELFWILGGEQALITELAPLLAALGSRQVHCGPVGRAAVVKLALNQMIGGLTAVFGHSLALVDRAGIDRERFLSLLRPSALMAPTFDKKFATTIGSNDYTDANFSARHLLKDMRLVLELAASQDLDLPLARAVADLLDRAVAAGHGDLDYSVLIKVGRPSDPLR